MEGSEVRQDTAAELSAASTNKLLAELALRHGGRKCYALVRNRDGKFHAGSTNMFNFTGVGKLYLAGLYNALDWFRMGRATHNYEDGTSEIGNSTRDMSEYTVVEYSAVEVKRTPADEWIKTHGTQAR